MANVPGVDSSDGPAGTDALSMLSGSRLSHARSTARSQRNRQMSKLTGKVALITGGNSGMGLATAQLFAAEGARVIITGRRRKETEEAAASAGPNVEGFVGDIADLADLDRLHNYIAEKYGRVDIV